jgi:hypothetical protein
LHDGRARHLRPLGSAGGGRHQPAGDLLANRKIAQKNSVCNPNANRNPSESVDAVSAADTATTIAITSEYNALMNTAVASFVSQLRKNACPAPGKIPMMSATGANPSSTSATTWARITASAKKPSSAIAPSAPRNTITANVSRW